MDAGYLQDKNAYLDLLRAEKARWEDLLSGLSVEQIVAPDLPSGWSIKDVIAHLMAWQLVTRARLQAARQERAPELPDWPVDLDPEAEDVDRLNAWIFNTYHDLPWKEVYRAWQSGFQEVIDMAESIPESDLLEVDHYPWLQGYSLGDVLIGTYEHHHLEHLEPLLAWLRAAS